MRSNTSEYRGFHFTEYSCTYPSLSNRSCCSVVLDGHDICTYVLHRFEVERDHSCDRVPILLRPEDKASVSKHGYSH